MKYVFTLLILSSIIFNIEQLSAQEPLNIHFDTQDSTSVLNGQVDVDVTVRNFENLIATQFTVLWDSTILEITEIPYISPDLPGLNVASFALPSQTLSGRKGRLGHAWVSGDALPKNLPDDHVLFTMRFKAIGSECDVTVFELLRTQNYNTEISNNDFVNIGAEINALPILITSSTCPGFTQNLACNSLTQLTLSPWEAITQLDSRSILEGGPYDYSVIEIEPSTISCEDISDTLIITVTHLPSGNSCWGRATVRDLAGPQLSFDNDLVIRLTNSGAPQPFSARLITEDLNDGTTDNCSDPSGITFSPEFFDFDCSGLGEQEIEVTATDIYGNSTTGRVTVTVELSQDLAVTCPSNVVVDCETDIDDAGLIESILGKASSPSGCIPVYEDMEGFDQNQDGDMEDEYNLNGTLISEDYIEACAYGTIRRVWSLPGSDATCVQIIGLNNVGSSFDGDLMIDWPYSLDAIVNVNDNDNGSCTSRCPSVNPDSIELVYDNDGNPIGANIVIECEEALCEEPFWEASSCSLIGWASETESFDLPNGSRSYKKTYFVIDACQFDTLTMEGRWSWEVNALLREPNTTQVVFSLPDTSVANGESICLPLTVENFVDIQSLQGSVNWDPTVAQFVGVEDFNLPGLNNGSFGINSTPAGKLSFAWFDNTTISPATLIDGDTLFSVCFQGIGGEGNSTLVSLGNDPTPFEVGSGGEVQEVLSYVFNQGSLVIGASNCETDTLSPTPYCVNLYSGELENDTFLLRAIDLDVGSFDNCTASEDLRFSFSDTDPETDPEFDGNTSSRVFTSDDLSDSGQDIELDLYVWDESGNRDFCTLNFRLIEEDTGDGVVEFEFGNYVAQNGGQLCVPLRTNNFSDVEAFQGTVVWDASVLEYTGTENFRLSGFTNANINAGNAVNGVLPFVWFDLTGQNPATLADGSAIFEVCFDVTGNPGDQSILDLVSTPALLQVSSAGVGVRETDVEPGRVRVITNDCSFDESVINWPDSVLNVFIEDINENNYIEKFLPDMLYAIAGIDSSNVYPVVAIPDSCAQVIGLYYNDIGISDGAPEFRVVRTWTVLDWLSGNAYSFNQIIKNVLTEGNICDTLPNSAPIGDCSSGHSLDDDVEWPDDISVADHRISPDELNELLGVDFEDTRPVFFNFPQSYVADYTDILLELNQTTLVISREWTVNRTDYIGIEWTYAQQLTVDISGFSNLVTINTHGFRPLPGVTLNSNAITDQDGKAQTEEAVDPERSDYAANGITVRDIVLARGQVLAQWELDEYQLRAADVGLDQRVSTLDLAQMENIILSKDTTLSRNWIFEDVTETLPGNVAPRAHYVAYKPGDIDDSANIGLQNPQMAKASLMIQDILLNAGERYVIPMYITGDIQAVASEIHLSFDQEKIDIQDVYTEQSFETVSYHIINGDRLSMLAQNTNLEPETLDSTIAMLVIEIEALENGTLKNVFGLSPNRSSYILDNTYEHVLIEDLFEGEISTSTNDLFSDGNAFRVFPNPATDAVVVQMQPGVNDTGFMFELYNIHGNRVLIKNIEQEIRLDALPGGSYIYRIIGKQNVQSGRLLIIR